MSEECVSISYPVAQDEVITARRRPGDKVSIDGQSYIVGEVQLALKVIKGGPLRCPHCDGPVQVLKGSGRGQCPHCSEIVQREGDALVAVEGIRAALTDGLSPLDRRLSQVFGVTAAEVREVMKQEG